MCQCHMSASNTPTIPQELEHSLKILTKIIHTSRDERQGQKKSHRVFPDGIWAWAVVSPGLGCCLTLPNVNNFWWVQFGKPGAFKQKVKKSKDPLPNSNQEMVSSISVPKTELLANMSTSRHVAASTLQGLDISQKHSCHFLKGTHVLPASCLRPNASKTPKFS